MPNDLCVFIFLTHNRTRQLVSEYAQKEGPLLGPMNIFRLSYLYLACSRGLTILAGFESEFINDIQ